MMITDVTGSPFIGIVNLVGLPGGWDDRRIDEERILAVQLMEAGRSPDEVAEILGVC